MLAVIQFKPGYIQKDIHQFRTRLGQKYASLSAVQSSSVSIKTFVASIDTDYKGAKNVFLCYWIKGILNQIKGKQDFNN